MTHWTGMSSWDLKAAYRQAAELRYLERKERRQGILPHIVNPGDPWSDVEMRTCEPGCKQHGGAA